MDMFFGSPKAELLGIDDIMTLSDGMDIASNNKEVKAESAADGGDKNAKLEALRLSFASCSKCGLAKTRTNIVFGEGNPYTDLMFVGEGPGADEDRTGRPFVGKSGQLLTKMIEAMGISRNSVYIANIVKCRPPENRNPFAEEAFECIGYLRSQIQIVNPKIIVCLGSVAVNFLLKPLSSNMSISISKARGLWHDFYGYKVMPTFHPSYLLRSPGKKKEAWLDLQKVMQELHLPMPSK